jgi:hypothetical protein
MPLERPKPFWKLRICRYVSCQHCSNITNYQVFWISRISLALQWDPLTSSNSTILRSRHYYYPSTGLHNPNCCITYTASPTRHYSVPFLEFVALSVWMITMVPFPHRFNWCQGRDHCILRVDSEGDHNGTLSSSVSTGESSSSVSTGDQGRYHCILRVDTEPRTLSGRLH